MLASPCITREIDIIRGWHTLEQRQFAPRIAMVRLAEYSHIFEMPLKGFYVVPYQYHGYPPA
jgi:hypothetical protein